MKSISKIKVLVAALAAAVGFAAQAADDGADHPDEALELTVPTGETWTYSGKITGTSSIAKSGLGTLVLSNPENTFTGGVTINEGTVEFTKPGAQGGDANVINLPHVSVETLAQVYFNFDGETATIKQQVKPTLYVSNDGKKTVVPKDQICVKYNGNVTVEGDVLFTRNSGNQNAAISDSTTDCTTIFKGKVQGSIYLAVWCYGKMEFHGDVTAGQRFRPHGGGTIEFYDNTKNHSFGWLSGQQSYGAKIVCMAPYLFTEDSLVYENKSSTMELDLNGFDQSFLGAYRNGSNCAGASDKNQKVYSSKPATLTFTSGADNISYAMFQDKITLVADLKSSTSPYLVLTNRVHTMTGDLIVSNGELRVCGTASFKNVPQIEVAGGTLNIDSTADTPFSSVTNVMIAGTLTFGTKVTANPFDFEKVSIRLAHGGSFTNTIGIQVAELRYESAGKWEKLRPGIYACDGSVLEGLVGGGSVIVSATKSNVASSWTAGGADTDVATADNWSNDGEYAGEGALSPTFATAGTQATVSSSFGFYNIFFDAPNDFSLVGTDDSAKITLMGNTIQSAAVELGENDLARSYTIDVPILYANQLEDYDDFVVRAEANTVIKLKDVESDADLKVLGTGVVELSGTNTFGGRVESVVDGEVRGVTESWEDRHAIIKASGLIVSADNPTRVITKNDDPYAFVFGTYGQSPSLAAVPVYFEMAGVEIRMPVWCNGRASSRPSVLVDAGTTNRFSGYVLTDSGSTLCIKMMENSYLEFAGGADFRYTLEISGDTTSTLVFSKTFHFRGTTTKYVGSVGTIIYSASGNDSAQSGSTGRWQVRGVNSRVITTVDEVWKNGRLYFNANGGLVDLRGTKQSIENVISQTKGEITGAYPACLEVTLGACEAGKSSTNICCRVTGGVSLMKGGAGTDILYLSGQAFESCGDLMATNGVLELAADATWLNGTNFIAKGTGTLKFAAAEQVNKTFATLHVADQGKIYVPEGVRMRFTSATLNGEPVEEAIYPTGTTGSTGLSAHIEGGGSIRIKRPGTVVVVQ